MLGCLWSVVAEAEGKEKEGFVLIPHHVCLWWWPVRLCEVSKVGKVRIQGQGLLPRGRGREVTLILLAPGCPNLLNGTGSVRDNLSNDPSFDCMP